MIMSAANDNYTIHKVSLKRTRQACGPCRRKKARCPGEKPTCSLCQRLGQHCSYGLQALNRVGTRSSTSHGPARSEARDADCPSSQRIQRIEDRLEEMTNLLQESLSQVGALTTRTGEKPSAPAALSEHRERSSSIPRLSGSPEDADDLSTSSLPPDLVKAEIDVYLTYFHDQPYCLFSRDRLLTSGGLLPPEIAYPLVALTSRLSGCSLPLGTSRAPAEYCAEKAWDILSHNHRSGNVGMSVMQGTFLMAQVDFADGRLHRAFPAVAMAIRTLQSAGLNKDRYAHCLDTPAAEERIRLTWAFFMLDRSYNASRNYSLCLSHKHFTLPFPSPDPTAAHRDPHSPIRGRLLDGPSKQGEKVDHGVLACLIRLYSIWGKTTEYVFAPSDKNALPPWQAGSAMARLESDWLQFETHFADTHRYIQVDFQRRAREEPQARGYLATWLYVQFLFHSVQAFLHHPFVIMVKLRQMDGNIPNTFLQKSYESSLLHSRWIARFVREMSEVGFCLYDPFLGYLAAIAATIQLEHTGSRNQQVASLVNKDFRTLVQFINGLSVHYDNMAVLVNRVNELAARHRNYGSLYYTQDRYSGALSRMPTPTNIPRMSPDDESLMWDILDLSSCVPPTDMTPLGDLALPPNLPGRRPLSEPPESPTPSEDTVQVRAADPRATLPPLSSQDLPALYGLDPDGMAVPGWPFAHRSANDGLEAGIPDIPDWLMLGGYEQL